MLLAIAIFYLIDKKLFYVVLFVSVGCFLKYKRAMMRIPISAEPVFFLGIMLTRVYGIQYSLILIFLSVFGVDVMAGDITINSIISFIVQLGLNLLAIFFVSYNIILFGFIVSIVNMVVSMVLAGLWVSLLTG